MYIQCLEISTNTLVNNLKYGFYLQACGFVEVISGFLLLCDSKRILLSRLLAAPDDDLLTHPPFYYLALGLLAAGLAMCATGALGCWATYMPSYAVLSIVS